MKDQVKKSPAIHSEVSVSGKKLVQARLPFKILSSPVNATKEVLADQESRKRKLSNDESISGPRKILCKTTKDENPEPVVLSDDSMDSVTKCAVPRGMSPSVKLKKIDTFIKELTNENGRIMLSPKTSTTDKLRDRYGCTSPTSSKVHSTTRLHIKLPISEEKKRKLSQGISTACELDSDVEIVSPDVTPGKKVKSIADLQVPENETIPEDLSMSSDSANGEVEELLEKSKKLLENQKQETGGNSEEVKELVVLSDSQDFSDEEETSKPIDSPCNPPSGDESLIDYSDVEGSNKSSQASKPESEFAKCITPLKPKEDGSGPQKPITPKQLKILQKREEKLKQKETEKLAKLKEKEEKLRSRQKEKEEKEEQRRKEKEEKEEQRKREKEEKDEQRKKEKEEKEEQRRKEKEEKERKRLEELEAKNEEKRQKEEEKRKKEEEKRKKEEEVEIKKRRAAEVFTKFFVQTKASSKDPDIEENLADSTSGQTATFVPFQIKKGMKLAPICRKFLKNGSKSALEEFLRKEDGQLSLDELYLSCLRTGKISTGKDSKTLAPEDENSDDCVVIADELEGAGVEIDEAKRPLQKYRAKYFFFHENRRPPYYGTWRKSSKHVKPRKPFGLDKENFDYEVDSDDEWEEEDPGESLHGSDDEKESEDDYEVDNEFMVPHGHLSDEELQNEDELEDNSPEMQKAKLKLLQAEFAQEMKKRTEKIKPRIVGIVWQDENGNKPEQCSGCMWDSLNKRAMIFTDPICLKPPEKPERETVTPEKKQPAKVAKLTEDHIKDLICLVHGNKHKKEFMIKEFQAFLSKDTPETEQPLIFRKSVIREQIERIAAWKVEMDEVRKKKRLCWVVAPDILQQYDLKGLSSINCWNYTLQPKRLVEDAHKSLDASSTPAESTSKETDVEEVKPLKKKKKKKKTHPEITKFTTVLSKDLLKSTLNSIDSSNVHLDNKKEESDTKSLQVKEKSAGVLKPIPDNKTVTKNTSALSPASASKPVQKKRVALLMSGPRGQALPLERKTALISEYLEKHPNSDKNHPLPPAPINNTVTAMEVETITLD